MFLECSPDASGWARPCVRTLRVPRCVPAQGPGHPRRAPRDTRADASQLAPAVQETPPGALGGAGCQAAASCSVSPSSPDGTEAGSPGQPRTLTAALARSRWVVLIALVPGAPSAMQSSHLERKTPLCVDIILIYRKVVRRVTVNLLWLCGPFPFLCACV